MRLAGYVIALLYALGFFGLMIVPLIDPDHMAGVVWGGAAAIGAVSVYMLTHG